MTLSEAILRYRAAHDMTQEEFAKKAGVTKLTILQIENGYREPRKVTLMKIKMAMED